jgi:hypothetical protein
MTKRKNRIPDAIHETYTEIVSLTDDFCRRHLDEEYAEQSRKLTAMLAHEQPSPLARGSVQVWAAAVLHRIGVANALFFASEQPHYPAKDIARAFGVSEGGMYTRSRSIRALFNIDIFDSRFARASRFGIDPENHFSVMGGVIMRHPTGFLKIFRSLGKLRR